MKTLDQIKQDIESNIRGAQVKIENSSLVVPKESWLDVAKFLKTHTDYVFDFLSSVTGVDYKDHFEVVYHLYSIEKREGPLVVRVQIDRQAAKIPSVTGIWRCAEFQEREGYDMFGIQFEGHPDLRRILMWEGFQHYPLRKDYVMENQDRKPEEF